MSKEVAGTVLIIVCIIILLVFVLFIVSLVTRYQKDREKFILDMEVMKNNFRNEILQSKLEIQQQTFQEISMEIHDNICQNLMVSKLKLSMIDTGPPEILEQIRHSVDLLSRATKDLRDLSRRLDSDMIRREGLYNTVMEYLSQIQKSVTEEIIFTGDAIPENLPVDRKLILFRILQEAINNILKHAGAGRILVDLSYRNGELNLAIEDNGRGFSMSALAGGREEGAGIKNMQKRTLMMAGHFTLESEPGKGTRIVISLPLEEVTKRPLKIQ